MVVIRILNVPTIPMGLGDAEGNSEPIIDINSRSRSVQKTFLRQRRFHTSHGVQCLDYYLEEKIVRIECLDEASAVNVLEDTGLSYLASHLPPRFSDAVRLIG
ncbi:MAG: hypothetical protein UW81_C0015G0006 [Candidatus Giovannonibacteria bacterium GW2011_GWC2_44_9]|uniref:Uncharacterized protein n=3 Tax=Candidatus Giovannoniibacteriota TaxID=1752738 RepID=A0A0G1L5X9_9BACT|nr:MAG: hypothetical protein UW49_C0004G0098 [Candidatus Giovannonibacteria bacterium GW2011_GWB1_44_23]KKT63987.1 MAG: hypothetical protein UW57_C0004G0097 [Candidatus Giovannonibacteria bacterium GW2011_GWA1_44_29]KKT83584.1 MAG: hypothetical protein UW81_C0015G0006 [Candidatus Giovannonibacteria bacterium GW2011_GWC2_44_9]KKT91180.1 MAG: hypothetical protein UW93_C0011G0004 [Parcubacteria group bacterium GW2011_GWC1_45_13]